MSVRKGYTGSNGALLDAYCTGKGSIAICKLGNVVMSMSAVKEQNGKIINKFLLTNALSSPTVEEVIELGDAIEED